MVADIDYGESSIADMIFVPPFDILFDGWPTTGHIYFLSKNSVCPSVNSSDF